MIALVLALAAAAAAAEPPAPPAVSASAVPHGLISQDDYPLEAIRRGEQGTVAVRLDVTPAGRVGACTVTASSGSALLDAATCRLLSARARFSPARDGAGNPVADTATTKITWRLQAAASSPALDEATRTWVTCLMSRAIAAARSRAPEQAVVEQVFAACPAEEAAVLARAAEVPGAGFASPEEARGGVRPLVLERIAVLRAAAGH
jgi:TonB family protein